MSSSLLKDEMKNIGCYDRVIRKRWHRNKDIGKGKEYIETYERLNRYLFLTY